MNKGFTLIEIIAIMVVLVGIFLVSFPSFVNMAKKDEQRQYDNMVENLCAAGKTYIYSNLDHYPELSLVNEEILLEINVLIAYGNVDKALKNPKTDLSVEKSSLKYTVLEDLSLKCEYIEE